MERCAVHVLIPRGRPGVFPPTDRFNGAQVRPLHHRLTRKVMSQIVETEIGNPRPPGGSPESHCERLAGPTVKDSRLRIQWARQGQGRITLLLLFAHLLT